MYALHQSIRAVVGPWQDSWGASGGVQRFLRFFVD
jgi:hypothetical protein